jgi:hypothetical protein
MIFKVQYICSQTVNISREDGGGELGMTLKFLWEDIKERSLLKPVLGGIILK